MKGRPANPLIQQLLTHIHNTYVKLLIIHNQEIDTSKKIFSQLGLLGGHRFLLGHWGMGVLYMFTCGGFMIAWIADFPKLPELISTARKDQGRLN